MVGRAFKHGRLGPFRAGPNGLRALSGLAKKPSFEMGLKYTIRARPVLKVTLFFLKKITTKYSYKFFYK